jgi:hypothetical protein
MRNDLSRQHPARPLVVRRVHHVHRADRHALVTHARGTPAVPLVLFLYLRAIRDRGTRANSLSISTCGDSTSVIEPSFHLFFDG